MPGRGSWMKRGRPIRQRSERKADENRTVAVPIVAEVFDRDGHRCILAHPPSPVDTISAGRCIGKLTPHHLRKQGQGGPWAAVNIVTLCTRHNGWVEQFPSLAHDLGLVIRTGETYADAWGRMRAAGLGVGPERDPATGSLL
jgi:hypothetical protein